MTGAPPRGLEQRLLDTRAKLASEVDLWVATSGSPGGVHLTLRGRVLMRDGRWLG